MQSAPPSRDAGPAAIARSFALPSDLEAVTPLGQGNVNDTYLVQCQGGERVVLQRLNTRVFPRPAEVMANLSRLCAHSAGRPWPQADQPRRWDFPRLVPVHPELAAGGSSTWLEQGGDCWRMLTYVADSHSHDTLSTPEQAAEVGRALGGFHHLIHDLPCAELHDTLPGFHVTPGYLEAYDRLERRAEGDPAVEHCAAFIEARRPLARVLEDAHARGELTLRPIHGDPKVNNVLFDRRSARAVALVDLDTVKPGLLHYDIGDALRSACNRAGEECSDLAEVSFDLELARPLLAGYLELAGPILSATDRALIPTAARLISFELGLRFYTDHLNGNSYFKCRHPRHNLERALVQFRLTMSIEEQQQALEQVVAELA